MREERPTIEAPGGPMGAYHAAPDPRPPGAGVVVIQEWWGLNENIEDICRRLAAEGYAAVAPDLYRGEQTDEPDDARKLAMGLDRARAIEDLKAAVTWLFDRGAGGVGTMGFCMGGSLVWELAWSDERLSAAVPFYGLPDLRGHDFHCPIVAHFGSEDRWTTEQLAEVHQELDRDRYAHELFVYPGAPHAFMNDTRPSYRKDAAELAWERTIAFFRNHLGS